MSRDSSLFTSSLHPSPEPFHGESDIVERPFWTPEQFWQYVEGRDGEFRAEQLRDVMAGERLVIVPAAEIERLRRENAQLISHHANFIARIDAKLDENSKFLDETLAALRAAGKEVSTKTAESGHSPSTREG